MPARRRAACSRCRFCADAYRAELAVSTVTGETILLLTTPDATMRYVGWLWD
ncbi:hypothetical protein [uncultured Alistipes sp.]|uniref:hypothetical protein n=1 Tax=uncultured Alistipes sp. TaxID=538949 RepID=UPI0023CDB453|nr:hypothetical protein [uncultured Alistipes sp.]MCX4281796.1 hypothetical protein [Alistipes sp.]MDE6876421.1 hypothetical protein [Alistipes sp.]